MLVAALLTFFLAVAVFGALAMIVLGIVQQERAIELKKRELELAGLKASHTDPTREIVV